jgi:hypothetical protein
MPKKKMQFPRGFLIEKTSYSRPLPQKEFIYLIILSPYRLSCQTGQAAFS